MNPWAALQAFTSTTTRPRTSPASSRDAAREALAAGAADCRSYPTDLADPEARDGLIEAVGRLGRESPAPPPKVAAVYGHYEDAKVSPDGDRLLDFDDMLIYMTQILTVEPGAADEFRSRYRCFVVDEYQDVNALQQRLLDLWLGGRQDVCVVGDPAQTIYSFTGATPRHLLDFTRTHPGARKVELVRNYRSTPQVIEVANRLMASPGGGRRSNGVVLRAQRPAGARVTVEAHADDEAEAAEVAGRIRALVDSGVPASSIAVLFRTNGQSEACESALTQAGVPYLVRGGERFFSRQEVKQAVVLLRGAARSDDGSVPMPTLARDVITAQGKAGADHVLIGRAGGDERRSGALTRSAPARPPAHSRGRQRRRLHCGSSRASERRHRPPPPAPRKASPAPLPVTGNLARKPEHAPLPAPSQALAEDDWSEF